MHVCPSDPCSTWKKHLLQLVPPCLLHRPNRGETLFDLQFTEWFIYYLHQANQSRQKAPPTYSRDINTSWIDVVAASCCSWSLNSSLAVPDFWSDLDTKSLWERRFHRTNEVYRLDKTFVGLLQLQLSFWLKWRHEGNQILWFFSSELFEDLTRTFNSPQNMEHH